MIDYQYSTQMNTERKQSTKDEQHLFFFFETTTFFFFFLFFILLALNPLCPVFFLSHFFLVVDLRHLVVDLRVYPYDVATYSVQYTVPACYTTR